MVPISEESLPRWAAPLAKNEEKSFMLLLLRLLLVAHVAHTVVADGQNVEAQQQHTNLRPPSRHGRVSEAVDALVTEHPSRHRSNHWAVLVAGSNTYMNYRHQADVYHAYQLLVSRGVPESQIVVFHYDDIAGHSANPIKGQVFNQPGGPDVYAGVPKDYTGEDVNKNTFLAVLRGEVVDVGSGKTLKTTCMSHIFVYYADHGSVGLVSMPVGGYLYAEELRGAIKELHANRRFSKFVFYLEACESGSMFESLPLDLTGVYTMTASNANEPSYACYWDQALSTYLGDCYSVNWLEDSDRADMRRETVEDQYEKVRNETSTSHVCQYGDKDVAAEVLALFQGSNIMPFEPAPNREEDGVAAATRMPVSQRDVRIRYLSHRVSTAKDTEGFEEAVRELSEEVRSRDRADQQFARALSGLMAAPALVDSVAPDCLRRSVEGTEELCGRFSEYSLKYVRYLYDSCRRGVDADKIVGIMREVCTTD